LSIYAEKQQINRLDLKFKVRIELIKFKKKSHDFWLRRLKYCLLNK
jgi:hypothetical protein